MVHPTPPTERNVLTHLTALIVVPGCLALGWWQVTRALSGNSLSWAYVFEWPIFAGYAVYMWWKLTHDDRRSGRRASLDGSEGAHHEADAGVDSRGAAHDPAGAGDEDEELASYNSYLAALNASGKRKHW